MSDLGIEINDHTPLRLRRAEKIPEQKNLEITANMTVVTTQGNSPEMRDQTPDATAPRKDQ